MANIASEMPQKAPRTAQEVPSLTRKALRDSGPGIGSRLESASAGTIRASDCTKSGNIGAQSGTVGAFPAWGLAEKRHVWRFFRQRRRFAHHGWRVSRRRKAEKPLESGSPGVA
jgi:hypothetical protein